MTELIGWTSSCVLLCTIAAQISKQWRERSSRGVSKWLYVGQVLASLGFAIYSALLHSWIFIFTNAALTLAAVIGLSITIFFQQTSERAHSSSAPSPNAGKSPP